MGIAKTSAGRSGAKSQPSAREAASLKIRPVGRESVAEQVTQQLMHMISSGELVAGQRLPPERELCQHFGVGRSSLREALRCLSMVGILDARVGEGTSVATSAGRFIEKSFEWSLASEEADFLALMQVRIALECAAAAEAAIHTDSSSLAYLNELLVRMTDKLDDSVEFGRLDLDFHVTIARASQNKLLYNLLALLRPHLERGLDRVLQLPNALRLSLEEHTSIARFVNERHPALARQAMQSHLELAVYRYRTSLE